MIRRLWSALERWHRAEMEAEFPGAQAAVDALTWQVAAWIARMRRRLRR